MTRVGAVDCGTNSIRLLIADVSEDGVVTDVLRRMEVVRLGQGVDTTGRIHPEALERTVTMAGEYARQCREHGVQGVRFVATSASRDASNADEFTAGIHRAFADLDVTPEVVSGAEEAALSFRGATGGLLAGGWPTPYLVVDLGGGSTEFVRGGAAVGAALSTNIGCVRLTERYALSDPPTADEITAARTDIEAALDEVETAVGFGGVATLVGLAGTVTTVTAQALGLDRYDSEVIHLSETGLEQTRQACRDLITMTRAQRAALPFMHPGRVDVIGAGALIWLSIIDRASGAVPTLRIVTSEHDILDGVALSVAERLSSTPAE
ncbi:Ppx/GppA phosphatase family protein [Kribbia dieselivorans]|uniref:Ppx/GppA phosphatase family protein n=1 Tax=Kribbia dieselivorans TaxID=331526 RepID=UPI00083845DB|nr:Ppx/GppA phosphatase family protein [Kribbia dieselivorans]